MNTNQTNENALTLTSAQVHQSTIGEYKVKVGGPKKGKNPSDYNTTMTADGRVYEFDVHIDFGGMALVDALWHSAVDLKTNAMNNIRPKDGDSDSVRQAKVDTLSQWAKDGKVEVRAADKARNLYQVSEEAVIRSLTSDKEKGLEFARTLRAKLLEMGVDPSELE